jgi:hypothetical protein
MKNMIMSRQRVLEVYLPTTTELHNDLNEALPAEDFQKIILEAIDETFFSLSEKAGESLYFQLEKTYKIAKQDIPFEIERFTGALEEIIGRGAILLEIEIMKHIHEKIGPKFRYSPKQKDLTFPEYVTATRAFLSIRPSARKPMPNEYYEYKFC